MQLLHRLIIPSSHKTSNQFVKFFFLKKKCHSVTELRIHEAFASVSFFSRVQADSLSLPLSNVAVWHSNRMRQCRIKSFAFAVAV